MSLMSSKAPLKSPHTDSEHHRNATPPHVRMKNTSIVRSTSRVRSETLMVACSATENGACGIADAAISAKGAQCCGKCTLQ